MTTKTSGATPTTAAPRTTSTIEARGRILVAYSGDARSIAAIRTLADEPDSEVVTLTLDFGRGRDLEEARDRALAAGAVRAHVLDVSDEYARAYLLRALKAGVLDAEGRPPADALIQPLMARKLVDIAHLEESTTVVHEYAGGGVRRLARHRLEAALRALDPTLGIVGVPAGDPPPDASPAVALPHGPAVVDIRFDRGEPTALNGIAMPLVELIDNLSMIAGAHGVGGSVPMAPSALVALSTAHRELSARVGSTEADATISDVTARYRDIVAKGAWFTPLREALDAFVDKIHEKVSGTVRLRLFEGSCTPEPSAIGNPPSATLTMVLRS